MAVFLLDFVGYVAQRIQEIRDERADLAENGRQTGRILLAGGHIPRLCVLFDLIGILHGPFLVFGVGDALGNGFHVILRRRIRVAQKFADIVPFLLVQRVVAVFGCCQSFVDILY